MKKENSVVIIGKGPSVLRSTKNWIDQFEKKAIINNVPFDGFEDKIGNHADYWFKNWQCTWYEDGKLEKIGIKRVINTAKNAVHAKGKTFRDLFPPHIEVDHIYFKQYFKDKYKLDPASGIMAIEYFVRMGFKNIGMVGIDLYQVGDNRYYVFLGEYGEKDNIQREASEHNQEKSLYYINDTIKSHPEIMFHIISDAKIDSKKNVVFA